MVRLLLVPGCGGGAGFVVGSTGGRMGEGVVGEGQLLECQRCKRIFRKFAKQRIEMSKVDWTIVGQLTQGDISSSG